MFGDGNSRVSQRVSGACLLQHVGVQPVTAIAGVGIIAGQKVIEFHGAMMGLARTGSFASNGSGDYVIAFSTHPDVRRPRESDAPVTAPALVNASMSPLFAAAAEATEEAIYNAIFKATTVTSSRGTLEAIPIDELRRILEKHAVLDWDESVGRERSDD